MSRQKSKCQKWIVCGFVVGIIGFIVVNIYFFEVINMAYLIMLVVYFIRFLYLIKTEE